MLESIFKIVAGLKACNFIFLFFKFFFQLGFLSQPFTNDRTAGEGGGHLFNSSLPLQPASQTLRYQPGDYCKELTSAHRQQLDSSQEPLASEHKSLTTKLRTLKFTEKRLQRSCFPINIGKFLITVLFIEQNTSGGCF